ncbi:MAG: hypothetical protein OES38_23675, partial [Gammaproteobacteria bacterium]|nr:hypothetical protein [Gammaproteobacteria bacterium]
MIGLAASAVALSCAPEVPENPTWFADVQPIMNANCARCHGADPYEPKLSEFRLDRYVMNDESSLDAFDFQQPIVSQAADLLAPAMPLDYRLSERQRTILRRWVDSGAPKGSRDNQQPSAIAIEPTDAALTVDQTLSLSYRAWDDDGDGLSVAIGVREKGMSGGDLLVSALGGGTRSVEIDTGQLASLRTFEVFAVVDDGFSDNPAHNQTEVVLLSEVFVDHGALGTAPTVVLLTPNGGATVIGAATISWSATDPDAGDTLTIDLDLVRVADDGTHSVVSNIASDLPNEPASFAWDTSAVAATDDSGAPIQ